MSEDPEVGRRIRGALRVDLALRLVWRETPGWTAAGAALLVVQGLLPLPALYLTKLAVDAVTAAAASADRATAFGQVAMLILLAGVVALAAALSRSLSDLVGEAQAETISDHVSDLIHARSVEVDLEYYESPGYYDALQRAQQEAPFRPTRIVNGLAEIAQSGISLLAVAGLLVAFHWGVAAILFAAALPGLALRLRYAGGLYRWRRERTRAERLAWYFHWILTDGGYAKEVRLFDLGQLFRGRFRGLREQLRREKLALSRARAAGEMAAEMCSTLAVYGTFAFVAYRTIEGAITLGDLVMYFQAFLRCQGFLQQLLRALASLYEDNLFLSHLHDFLSLKPKVVEPTHPRRPPRPVRRGIRFERVAFRYPTGDRPVLRDVTLEIPAGKTVALVGANGSGKTTLAKLLCRLYDPTEGSISLDGMDLREMSTVALRREISVLFQDFARYDLSAWENIRLGDIALSPGDERIAAAARLSGADRVIGGLPHGYDTVLGHSFEDGRELSMGEWQSLALARAFARDAQIVVLDEPTSALDAEAEYGLFTRFRRLVEGRTALLISHRFSTARMADCIYVLEDGAIVEGGTHEELVRRGGYYARAFETQARSYR